MVAPVALEGHTVALGLGATDTGQESLDTGADRRLMAKSNKGSASRLSLSLYLSLSAHFQKKQLSTLVTWVIIRDTLPLVLIKYS